MVRAKFSCVEKTQAGGGFNIRLTAVTSGSEENKSFFDYTPAGELTLQTVNLAAAEQFVEGSEYYIDFSPAQ